MSPSIVNRSLIGSGMDIIKWMGSSHEQVPRIHSVYINSYARSAPWGITDFPRHIQPICTLKVSKEALIIEI